MECCFWYFHSGCFRDCIFFCITHYRKTGEILFVKGHLFELTPTIARIERVAAVVWLLGAGIVFVSHVVRYYKVEHYIKKHQIPAEKQVKLVAEGIKHRLKIRGNIEVYRCYGISSPLVHIRQNILIWKGVGRLLEDVFWYNPLIYLFNRKLDFWSELACDMECCRISENIFSVRQYFHAALELLTQEPHPLAFPFSMFGGKNDLQARIGRMKQYRIQKELRLPAVAAGFVLFFLASIGLTFGVGIGTQKAVQEIYARTVETEIEDVQNQVMDEHACYVTQMEINADAGHSYMVKEAPYDVYKQAVMDAFPEDITEDSIRLSAEIPKQMLCQWAVEGKPKKIRITVDTSQPEKTVRIGLVTSAHKQMYIEANGEVEQLFETSGKEFIQRIFIENTGENAITISGIATIQN